MLKHKNKTSLPLFYSDGLSHTYSYHKYGIVHYVFKGLPVKVSMICSVADPEGVQGVRSKGAPFETKLFCFYGEFSENSGKNSK